MANVRLVTKTRNGSNVDDEWRQVRRRATIVAAFPTMESARAAREAVLALTPSVHHAMFVLHPTTDAIERLVDDNLARGGARGAALGAIGMGTLAFLVTLFATDNSGALALAIGAAIAFTGGPFFGGLTGFAMQTTRWGAIRNDSVHLLDRRVHTASLLIVHTRPVGRLSTVLAHHGGEVTRP